MKDKPNFSFYAGITLMTCSAIVFEILLTRMFSIILWYHYGFLVLSTAMLGIGIGGYVAYLIRNAEWTGKRSAVAALSAVNGLVVLAAALVIMNTNVKVDIKPQELIKVLLVIFMSFLPFFFTGLCMSLAFRLYTGRIGRIYFADLAGAAAGCAMSILLLDLLGGPSSTLAATFGFFAAALCLSIGGSRRSVFTMLALCIASAALLGLNLNYGFVKIKYQKGYRAESRKAYFEKWNAMYRVVVRKTVYGKGADDFFYSIDIDSGAGTAIIEKGDKDFSSADIWGGVSDLVYKIKKADKALIIGVGGGSDVRNALDAGVEKIVGVDINPIIIDVVKNVFGKYAGNIYSDPRVTVTTADGRSFVRRTDEKWGIIQATMVDTWAAASSGAFALAENYLYTVEAFEDYLNHMEEGGVLSFTRWVYTEPREMLRLTVLARLAWENQGHGDFDRHVIIIKSQHMHADKDLTSGTFLLKTTPFTADDIEIARAYCLERECDVIAAPDLDNDNQFTKMIRTDDPMGMIRDYPLNILPTYDDRPFFFYFVKKDDMKEMVTGSILKGKVPLQNVNNLAIFIVIFLMISVCVVMAIMLAVFFLSGRKGTKLPSKLPIFLYFSSIGVGFIMIEVYLLQKFILFLGHPAYALSVILFSLLLASGVGSYLMEKMGGEKQKRPLAGALVFLLSVIALYFFIIPPIASGCLNFSLTTRIVIVIFLIAPLGLTMGIPFPTGLRILGKEATAAIPWGWCFNGIAAVMGSSLSVFISIMYGLKTVLLVSFVMYLICLLASFAIPEKD